MLKFTCISLFILIKFFSFEPSPKLLNGIKQIVWIDKKKLLIVDSEVGSFNNRILKYDIKKKKTYPIYNGEFRNKNLLCCISYDGKRLAIYNRKTYKIKIIDLPKGKVIFSDSLNRIMKKQGFEEYLYLPTLTGKKVERLNAIPNFISKEKFLLFIKSDSMESGYGYIAIVDYINRKISIKEIPGYNRGIPGYEISEINERKYIFLRNYNYFDINNHIIKQVLPSEIEEKIKLTNGPLGIFNNKVFFFLENSFYSYNIQLKKLNKIPIDTKTASRMSKYYFTKKYLYAILNNTKGQLFRTSDFKPVNCLLLEKLRKEGYEILNYVSGLGTNKICGKIMCFSPVGDMIFTYDPHKNRIRILEIKER